MSRNKYIFDPQRLHYEQLDNNLKNKTLRIVVYVMASMFIALAFVVLYSLLFDTPREREVRQENVALTQDYMILKQKYERVDTVLKELKDIDENIYRTIFETEPLGGHTTDAGTRDFSYLLELSTQSIVDSTAMELNGTMHVINRQSIEYQNLISNAGHRKSMLSSIPGIQPLENRDLTRLASGYGYRMHPIYKIEKFHEGIDFTAPTGTEVFATGNGKVADIDRTGRGHGNAVVIDHGYGYKTSYSHLDEIKVRYGQKVTRGDVIGLVGNTGLSVAPHLHYEVLLNDKAVNPVNYFFLDLDPEAYNRMIELSVKSGQSFD
ncbi:MAG TPA: M23 family metallopeptidase [Bacteroidales bacterium]|nr:M23 family metallopeptidase [Bacteroidales bacterium]